MCDVLCQVLLVGVEIVNLLDLCDDVSSEYYQWVVNVLFNSQDYDVLLVIYFFSVVVLGIESVLVLIDVLKYYLCGKCGKYVIVLINWCGEFFLQEV